MRLRVPGNKDPKKPTVDERLDRLNERHEALTQTVELIVAMQRDNENRAAENEKRFAEIASAIQQDAENIRALVRIAEIPEQRLSDLQGNQQ